MKGDRSMNIVGSSCVLPIYRRAQFRLELFDSRPARGMHDRRTNGTPKYSCIGQDWFLKSWRLAETERQAPSLVWRAGYSAWLEACVLDACTRCLRHCVTLCIGACGIGPVFERPQPDKSSGYVFLPWSTRNQEGLGVYCTCFT